MQICDALFQTTMYMYFTNPWTSVLRAIVAVKLEGATRRSRVCYISEARQRPSRSQLLTAKRFTIADYRRCRDRLVSWFNVNVQRSTATKISTLEEREGIRHRVNAEVRYYGLGSLIETDSLFPMYIDGGLIYQDVACFTCRILQKGHYGTYRAGDGSVARTFGWITRSSTCPRLTGSLQWQDTGEEQYYSNRQRSDQKGQLQRAFNF